MSDNIVSYTDSANISPEMMILVEEYRAPRSARTAMLSTTMKVVVARNAQQDQRDRGDAWTRDAEEADKLSRETALKLLGAKYYEPRNAATATLYTAMKIVVAKYTRQDYPHDHGDAWFRSPDETEDGEVEDGDVEEDVEDEFARLVF